MSFCHEEAAELLTDEQWELIRAVVTGRTAEEGQPGSAVGIESGLF